MTGPWTKKELAERKRFIRDGWWNDSILVFMDREVYATSVTLVPAFQDRVRLIGYERSLDAQDSRKPVNELIDPRDVTRVIH